LFNIIIVKLYRYYLKQLNDNKLNVGLQKYKIKIRNQSVLEKVWKNCKEAYKIIHKITRVPDDNFILIIYANNGHLIHQESMIIKKGMKKMI